MSRAIMMIPASDIAHATTIIAVAERDLGELLSDGQRRDLLADQTEWPTDHIAGVIEAINVLGILQDDLLPPFPTSRRR